MSKKTLPLVLLWVLLLSLCSQSVSAPKVTIPNQEHFIMETICDPESVDPAWAIDTASRALIFNVYDPLVFFDQQKVDEFIPYLATDWWINQPPHPFAPAGTNNTWYFRIRGTSGTHTTESMVEVPAGDPTSTYWHEVYPWYSKNWHIREWIDDPLNPDGILSPSDIIKMDRACQNWDGEEPMPVDVWQTFHVNEVIGTFPGYVTIEVTELPVKFHDGSDLTTEDVEYSFERLMVMDRSGGPAWKIYEPLLGRYSADMDWPEDETCPINTAVESNATHVWFNLAMPYPPFMQILCGSWASIVNQEFCVTHGCWPSHDWTNWKAYHDPEHSPLDDPENVMCGTGPYMGPPFEDPEIGPAWWTHGVEWSIVRFVDHWQQWPAPHCSRYLNRVTNKVVYEWGTRLADYIGGYADQVYVPRQYLPQMIENWPVKCMCGQLPPPPYEWNPEEYLEGPRCLPCIPTLVIDAAMFFNFDTNPATTYCGSQALDGEGIPLNFFNDMNIRKAFAYSFNYTEFIEDFYWGEAVQPTSCVIEGKPYHNPENPTYYYDRVKAKEHFQAAGPGMGEPEGAVWDRGFKMTIIYNAGHIPREAAAYMLKDGVEGVFADYGGGPVTITVIGVPWSTFQGQLVGHPLFKSLMPLFITGWLNEYTDPHDDVHTFMHSAGHFSRFQGYSNAYVDALIEEGIATPDGPEREEIYNTLQLMYYQEVPSVGLAQPLKRHWERDWVQGWHYNPLFPGQKYFKHMWKGLNGDINGDNRVDILDLGMVSAHWYPGPPEGPLGYDKIADVCPELQYNGIPKVWDPALEEWVPHPSIGAVDIFDAALISAHWLEEVDP